MKHNSRMYGFTLMEVLLTMTMLAFIITPIMIQQGALLRNVPRFARYMQMLRAAQAFLYETQAQLQPGTATHEAERKLDDIYNTTVRFRRTAIGAKSAVGSFTNLYQDQVLCSWKEDGQNKQDALVTYLYQTPLPEKKS
jgi:hypothetical protein